MKVLEYRGGGFAAPMFHLQAAFVLFEFLFDAPAFVVETFKARGGELASIQQAGGEDFEGTVFEWNPDEPEGAGMLADAVLTTARASAATWTELNHALGESGLNKILNDRALIELEPDAEIDLTFAEPGEEPESVVVAVGQQELVGSPVPVQRRQ